MASKKAKGPGSMAQKVKKIMQADEDTGKLAQGAPVVLARAVELLIQDLIRGTAAAMDPSCKTMTPSHVKAFVLADKQTDFLADKVADIADAAEKPRRRKAGEGESKPTAAGAKELKAGRRKRRTAATANLAGEAAPKQDVTQAEDSNAVQTAHADASGATGPAPAAKRLRTEDSVALAVAQTSQLPVTEVGNIGQQQQLSEPSQQPAPVAVPDVVSVPALVGTAADEDDYDAESS